MIQAQVGDGDAIAVAKVTVTESLKNPFRDELPAWALSSIVRLYRQGIISSGKAAELLGMARAEFIPFASRLGLSALDMTSDEWEAERIRSQAL